MVIKFPEGLQPFFEGLYNAVDDPSSGSIISWSWNNKSFIIWDYREFESQILSRCGLIRCNDFLGFLYELRRWGFKRARGSPHRFEFEHRDYFKKGRPDLLKRIQNKAVATSRLKFLGKDGREKELADELHHLRI
ncbi:unnamed protein product [Thlaspi arvense]|uniref:HSF-type DNA-binding domain-containing protein n=1 Tax=Thlaspi arvense TaxID=13288 RepID=A0AAU9T7I6_THLAR|nr:unnamed protein product [Thlaspi arvense]